MSIYEEVGGGVREVGSPKSDCGSVNAAPTRGTVSGGLNIGRIAQGESTYFSLILAEKMLGSGLIYGVILMPSSFGSPSE